MLGVAPEEVTPEAHFFADLGVDSIDVVELVLAFESEFEIELADEVIADIVTVGDAIDRLRRDA